MVSKTNVKLEYEIGFPGQTVGKKQMELARGMVDGLLVKYGYMPLQDSEWTGSKHICVYRSRLDGSVAATSEA